MKSVKIAGSVLAGGVLLGAIFSNLPAVGSSTSIKPKGGWCGVVFHLHGAGKAYAVDERTGEVLAEFDTGKGGTLGAVTPDCKKLYVSNAGEGQRTVSIIDVVNLKKIKDVETGSRPKHALPSPDGKLVGVDHWGFEGDGTQRIVFLDASTDEVVKVITYNPQNRDFKGVTSMHNAWSLDSRYFFTIVRADSKVLIVDTKTWEVMEKSFPSLPHYMVPRPGGKEVWIVTEGKSDGSIPPEIYVLDITKRDMPVIARMAMPLDGEEAIEGHHGNFDAKGKYFFINNRGPGGNFKGRAVAVFDADSKKLVADLRVGSTGVGHTYVSPDGKYVIVTNYGNNVISIIDAKNLSVIKNLTIGTGRMGHVAFSSDGKRAFVSNDRDGALYMLDMDKMEVVKKITTNGNPGAGQVLSSYYVVFENVPRPLK